MNKLVGPKMTYNSSMNPKSCQGIGFVGFNPRQLIDSV